MNISSNNFKWRQRGGIMQSVSEMRTDQIFFTLRIIWNSTEAAKLFKVTPFKPVVFGLNYTPEYLEQAVKALISEFMQRVHAEAHHTSIVHRMAKALGIPVFFTPLEKISVIDMFDELTCNHKD